MAAFAADVSVFAHTSLGTRIAMNVPQDITAGAFKRDFERMHYSCLPDSGEIQVNGLMVKRKSCFYYLPDSLPLKCAFHGMRSTWFLHVEASHIKNLCISCLHQAAATTLLESQDRMTCNAKNKPKGNNGVENNILSLKKKKKKKKMKFSNEKHMQNTDSAMQEGYSVRLEEKPNSQFVKPENEVRNPVKLKAISMQGSLNEMSTEVISVTGIINKYFPSPDGIDNFSSPSFTDVTSRAVHKEIKDQPKSPKTPPSVPFAPSRVDSVPKTSRDRRRESKVRKRLLDASHSLGVSTNKHSPAISLCRFNDGKLLQHKSQTKGLLFEISDTDY